MHHVQVGPVRTPHPTWSLRLWYGEGLSSQCVTGPTVYQAQSGLPLSRRTRWSTLTRQVIFNLDGMQEQSLIAQLLREGLLSRSIEDYRTKKQVKISLAFVRLSLIKCVDTPLHLPHGYTLTGDQAKTNKSYTGIIRDKITGWRLNIWTDKIWRIMRLKQHVQEQVSMRLSNTSK